MWPKKDIAADLSAMPAEALLPLILTNVGGTLLKILAIVDNNSMYLGNQVACEFGEGRCYGLLAGLDFLLVCEYGENGADPELVMYMRR